MGVKVVGLDIDGAELQTAPASAYDRTIVADLCTFEGFAEADIVICQTTLEHVPNVKGAMRAIATSLRTGGRAYIFAPCSNTAFAKLNMLLPQSFKRRLLFSLFPHKADGHSGFPAYYDHCTPRQIETLAAANGFRVEDKRLFWTSSYFFVLTPGLSSLAGASGYYLPTSEGQRCRDLHICITQGVFGEENLM